MATREIKTTIALDGEQKFKQALSAATREMRVMESEMKAVSAAYDANGNSAEFFAAKQQNLRNQISQQRQIIEALEKAVEDAGDAYGESSSQVDGYAIRLNNARARMSRLEKQLEETDREVEELGRDSVKAGRQLEQGISDGAESAEGSLKSLISTMQQDISSIKTSTAFTAVSGLWNAATSAYSAVTGFVDGTVEYRRQLSFLQQNAETAGFDFSYIKDQLIEVQALTGDSSSAVEALSNLLAADVDARQMEAAINNIAGAVIAFPDTMKFESLADSLQETIATGSATGQFAELLGRLGVDVEEFNKALEESDSEAGDLDIALAYLADNGMANVYQQWQATNGAMNEAAQTQAAIELEMAEFAGTLEKYLTAPLAEAKLNMITWLNDVIEIAENSGLDAAVDKIANDAKAKAAESTETLITSDVTGPVAQKGIEIMSEGGLQQWIGKQILGDQTGTWTESFDAAAKNAIKDFGEGVDTIFYDIVEGAGYMLQDMFGRPFGIETNGTTTQQQGAEAGTQYAEAFGEAYKTWVNNSYPQLPNPLENVTPTDKMIDTLGVRDEWQQMLDGLTTTTQEATPQLQESGRSAGSAIAEAMGEAMEAMSSVGKEGAEAMGTSFESALADLPANALTIGSSIGAQLAAGLLSQVSYVGYASGRLGAAASAGLGSGSGSYGGAVGATSGAISAVLNIDGKTFARVTAPYLSSALTVTG